MTQIKLQHIPRRGPLGLHNTKIFIVFFFFGLDSIFMTVGNILDSYFEITENYSKDRLVINALRRYV